MRCLICTRRTEPHGGIARFVQKRSATVLQATRSLAQLSGAEAPLEGRHFSDQGQIEGAPMAIDQAAPKTGAHLGVAVPLQRPLRRLPSGASRAPAPIHRTPHPHSSNIAWPPLRGPIRWGCPLFSMGPIMTSRVRRAQSRRSPRRRASPSAAPSLTC
jgi:hypothetical protein